MTAQAPTQLFPPSEFPLAPPTVFENEPPADDVLPATPSDPGDTSPPTRPVDPRWVRPALFGLLGLTAVLYLWGLGASGWANSFYSAAVQAGTKSWKAAFFGSSDASNFITVDKSPASLWVMELSARIFGLNSWSLLVPQALEGVAAVALLYAAVKRWFSPSAGLIAGLVLALTPAAALMFRFNNPDALLVLLLTAGAYAMVRALETAHTKWLMLAWSLVGFAFLAKMLQAFLVAPAFALVYLIAAPAPLKRRLWQLILGGVAMLAAAGWWVAIVELWPKSSRPYIGGSQNNSVLDLIFGYNGFGRLTGNETGSVGGGGQGTGMWGPTGWYRLFNANFGGQASWLIPSAAVLLVAGLIYSLRAPRIDRTRAALVLWGGWFIVTAVALSFGKGIIHEYYTVALAPAIGGIIGVGSWLLWQRRSTWLARSVLALAVLAAAWWSRKLLQRTPNWHPELRTIVLVGGILAAAGLLFGAMHRRFGPAVAAVGVAVALLGPGAYSIATAATAHSGAIPLAGPAAASRLGGPGGGAARGPAGGRTFTGANGQVLPNGQALPNGQPPAGFTPPTGANGATGVNPGAARPNGAFGGAGGAGGTAPGGAGGIGGLLNGSKPTAELVAVLEKDAGSYRWIAATIGANNASGYQLSTGDPVMAIGGFNGTDPWPTLEVFEQYVQSGQIHYFIGGGGVGGGVGGGIGGGGAGGGNASSTSSAISAWVAAHYTAQTVGGVTLYDLTAPAQ